MSARANIFDTTLVPTEAGELVRFVGYGGPVRAYMAEPGWAGKVVRFTRAGNPVIEICGPAVLAELGVPSVEVTDTFGCARVIDEAGKLVRPEAVTR